MAVGVPGLHCGHNEPLGRDLLDWIRERGFKIVRTDVQECTFDQIAQYSKDIVDAGLQPLCIIKSADQCDHVAPGGLIEAGNEPDLKKFGWTERSYEKMFLSVIERTQKNNQRLYGGVVSNLNKRGFNFLKGLPWKDIPATVCCSVHRYPDGHLPTNPHDGFKSREQEVQNLRRIVGNRPLAVTEVGYHQNEWTEAEAAANMAWERKFFAEQGFDFVIGYQLNDGPPENTDYEAHFGFRRFNSMEWKPVAEAFVTAL